MDKARVGLRGEIKLDRRARKKMTIPTSDSFDATTINPTTVRFGKTGTEATAVDINKKDVNGDSQPDLLLKFRTQDSDIQCGDRSVSITAQTVNGTPIQGSDSITTVGCKSATSTKNKT